MPASPAATIAHALGGNKSGAGWMARCPAHEDSTPSLSLRDAHDGRLLVYCHAGCDQRTVIAALAQRGLWTSACPDHQCSPRTTKQVASDGKMRACERKRTLAALRVWAQASPAPETAVEVYLRRRGITIPLPHTIKFHCSLAHPSGREFPAMVALVAHGFDNRPVGIHRTFLDPETELKANVQPNKMMLGPCRGGVVRLGPATKPLMIGEGIETCLAAMQATRLSAWAALSTSGMVSLALPRDILDVVILADGDAPGERAAATAARRWSSSGRRIRIARPPLGQDFNDVLLLGD